MGLPTFLTIWNAKNLVLHDGTNADFDGTLKQEFSATSSTILMKVWSYGYADVKFAYPQNVFVLINGESNDVAADGTNKHKRNPVISRTEWVRYINVGR